MKRILRQVIRSTGFDIVRYPPLHSHSGRMRRLFEYYQIDTVIDVGANEGQFGRSLRDANYSGRIFSFEPLSSAHQALAALAASDQNWVVAPRMAIGRVTGDVVINVAENLESSSILPMSDLHREASPTSRYTETETVPMNTLDDVVMQYILSPCHTLLKIDTQGFEAEVLAGASNVLSSAVAVQLELSLAQLYDGQAGYLDLIQFMMSKGYSLAEINPGFSDPRTGHLLQADGVFVKKGA